MSCGRDEQNSACNLTPGLKITLTGTLLRINFLISSDTVTDMYGSLSTTDFRNHCSVEVCPSLLCIPQHTLDLRSLPQRSYKLSDRLYFSGMSDETSYEESCSFLLLLSQKAEQEHYFSLLVSSLIPDESTNDQKVLEDR